MVFASFLSFPSPYYRATDVALAFQVAVVTVAFPATPLLLARARICISASHTREDLIKALDVSAFVC
jgi:7-keto-8-aminopelargonate synthetase-like enzyme